MSQPPHSSPDISNLLVEDRAFPPSPAFRRRRAGEGSGHLRPRRAGSGGLLGRLRPRARLDSPVGCRARLEAARREVVRWREAQRRGQLRRPPRADRAPQQGRDHLGRRARRPRTLTYFDLYREVNQFANVLKELGVRKGDRVAIYLPLIPELAIAMLACARIGAVHSVVFGGFSAESLRDRINDSPVHAAHHGRWRLSPRPDRAAQADRRRGAHATRRPSRTWSSSSATRQPLPACTCRRAATTGTTG